MLAKIIAGRQPLLDKALTISAASHHSSPAFLLQNGISYHIAHVCGVVEFLLEAKYQSSWKSIPRWYIWLGAYIEATSMVVTYPPLARRSFESTAH